MASLVRKIKDKAGFGSRVRAARKAAGLTQSDLARVCGVTLQAVLRWEHGVNVPKVPEVREKMALVLGVGLRSLELGYEGEEDMLMVAARRVPVGLRRYAVAMLKGLCELPPEVESSVGTPGVQLNASVVAAPLVVGDETKVPVPETKVPVGGTVPPGYEAPKFPGS